MEVRRYPSCVVDHQIHVVGHVDEPAGSSKAEHDERQPDSEYHWFVPWQCCYPTQQTSAAAMASGDLQTGAHREDGQKGWQGDQKREEGLNELESHADLWIGEQVMDPHWRGKQQEHDEAEAAHRVAVEASACGLRH